MSEPAATTPETPAVETPAADLTATVKQLEQELSAAKLSQNELSSLKALIERGKVDPEELLLAFAGKDASDFMADIVAGKYIPKGKAARKQAEEATEVEKLRAFKAKKEAEELEGKNKEIWKREIELVQKKIAGGKFPLVESLGLSESVLRKLYEKQKFSDADLEETSKEVEELEGSRFEKLASSEKAIEAVLARPSFKTAIQKALGITSAEAAEIVEAVRDAAGDEEEKPKRTTRERREPPVREKPKPIDAKTAGRTLYERLQKA